MRLNKYIAQAGIASRRKADELIQLGMVTVNGKKAELGMTVNPAEDHVKVRGKLIHKVEEKIYVLLNKPAGYICSVSDPDDRPLVTDLLKEYKGYRLYPVGRLDYNTEGLIILTNDGEFASKVGHPSTGPAKTYSVRVRGVPNERILEILRNGVHIDGYKTRPAKVTLVKSAKNAWLEITIKEGKNKQIRKMFEAVDHAVVRLKRIRIGSLNNRGLNIGEYRLLTPQEIDRLMST